MAEEQVVFPKMFFYDDDSDTPQKCRDRRRLRIELRRSANATEVESPAPKNCAVAPEFGFLSLAGKRRDMEDAVSVQINLCSPEICRRNQVHFFAVFDGHGGPQVAAMCRERMHLILKEELGRVKSTRTEEIRGEEEGSEEEEEVEGWWKEVFRRAFNRMDEEALSSSYNGSGGEFPMAGSTAVVAVITHRHLVVANCGDSRAVLCRRLLAVPLSSDHKPDRPDELARIHAAGGRVINAKGTRVQGILAMSRSIGDKLLKRFVTSEPEVTITRRKKEDECLIIASDGLWDVISNELACEIARSSLEQWRSQDQETDQSVNQSMLVASLLTRLALGRDSCDNITTIVVDLNQP